MYIRELCRERILYVRRDLLFAASTETSWGRKRCDRTPIQVTPHRSTRPGGSCRAAPRRARSLRAPREVPGVVDATVIDESAGTSLASGSTPIATGSGRQTSPAEEDPSGGSGGMRDPCCKHIRKEIEGGKPRRGEEDPAKGEILPEIDCGDQGLLAADSGTHHPPTPREERRGRGPGMSCVSGPAANEEIESSYLIIDCKNNAVLKSLYHEHVCTPLCAPLCSTGQMLYIRCPGCLRRERSSG